jgi:hypothetical protein
MPGINIGQNHVLEQGRFSHARFPDHIHVPPPIIRLNPKPFPLITKIHFSKQRDFIFVFVRIFNRHNQ